MKYHVENNLDLFEFHDADVSFVSFDNNELILSARHLNIHKNTDENPNDNDMEITLANVTFLKFKVLSFEPMRTYQIDDDGKWYTNEPRVIINGKEAEIHFLENAKKGFSINCIDVCKQKTRTKIEFSASTPNPFFTTISFEDVVIEWNEYCKKAWYELHKQYIYKGYLNTPAGEVETEIHIVCHEEDTYFQGKLEKGPTVSVGVKYNGRQLWGQGKDYLWVDAFANVQKQLPDGVLLKCCMTCRHGNMCPYGNEPGKLFCTKGLIVGSKEDMCNLFDDQENSKIFDRIKSVADSCNEYTPQSNDYYTYNDYLYRLEK